MPSWTALVCARGIEAGLEGAADDELVTLFSIEALAGRAAAVLGSGDECAGLPPHAAPFVRRSGIACVLPSGAGGATQPLVYRAVLAITPPGSTGTRLVSLLRAFTAIGAEVQPALSVLAPGCQGAPPPRVFFAQAVAAAQPAASAATAAAAAGAGSLDVASHAHVDTATRLLARHGITSASSAQELVAAVCGGGGGGGGSSAATTDSAACEAAASGALERSGAPSGRGRRRRQNPLEASPDVLAFLRLAGVHSLADFRHRVIGAASAGDTDTAFVAAIVGMLTRRVSDYRLAVTDEDARKATRAYSITVRGGLSEDVSFVAALSTRRQRRRGRLLRQPRGACASPWSRRGSAPQSGRPGRARRRRSGCRALGAPLRLVGAGPRAQRQQQHLCWPAESALWPRTRPRCCSWRCAHRAAR